MATQSVMQKRDKVHKQEILDKLDELSKRLDAIENLLLEVSARPKPTKEVKYAPKSHISR